MSKFEDSLRELVREELKGQKPAPAPDRRQVFWLFLCVTNTAMLLWLLPETIFNNQRTENLGRFVVWLSSSVFISSFIWFREKLLGLTQSRIVRVALGLAFPILTLLYISQLSIFPIHPIIEPSGAELIIDGQHVNDEDREDLRLSLSEHPVTVQPAGWLPQNNNGEYPRKFKLTRLDLFSAWWSGQQPRWPLIYDVYIEAKGPVDEVVVQSVGQDLDREFVRRPYAPLAPATFPVGAPLAKGRELVYQWHGTSDALLPLRLPYGRYVIFSRKKDCAGDPAEVVVPVVGSKTTVLKEPCAQSQ